MPISLSGPNTCPSALNKLLLEGLRRGLIFGAVLVVVSLQDHVKLAIELCEKMESSKPGHMAAFLKVSDYLLVGCVLRTIEAPCERWLFSSESGTL